MKPVFQIPSEGEGMAFCLEKHRGILAISHNIDFSHIHVVPGGEISAFESEYSFTV